MPHGVYEGRCWVGVLQKEDTCTDRACAYMDTVRWPQIRILPGLPQVLDLHGQSRYDKHPPNHHPSLQVPCRPQRLH